MSESDNIKKLIDSFIEYRNVLVPLQESLNLLSKTYEEIRTDLDNLTKSFSGNASAQLEKIHSTINAQAKSGQELGKKIEEYSQTGDKYAQAVSAMTGKFAEVSKRLEAVAETERAAESMLGKLDSIINEKRTSYNLKELQKSLDFYNRNVEKVGDFINKDIADVLKSNAEKIEEIKKGNDELSAVVSGQGEAIVKLSATFAETSALLKKTVEGGAVNEEYLFDAFDKWAADRKVKIKKN